MSKVRCFYFAKEDRRLAYGDSRLVRRGITHSVDCVPRVCVAGLHGSRNVYDALQYASSSKLYLVDIWGDVDEGEDKLCGTHREYLEYFNAEKVLFEFARKQASINLHKIKPYCSEDDYELVGRWLRTGDLRIRSAARSAAWSAARSAARSAVRSVAESAGSAVRSAAWSAARSVASQDLQETILEATRWQS